MVAYSVHDLADEIFGNEFETLICKDCELTKKN